MQIELLPDEFSVLKLAGANEALLRQPFTFWAYTDTECSLVCKTAQKPARYLACEDGWRALRVCGVLDFSLIGILAGITKALAESGVGVFVVSTFDTDYVLVKAANVYRAADALRDAGYEINPG